MESIEIIQSVVVWALTAVLAGVSGYLVSFVKSRKKHDDAMEQGMRVLLRTRIVDAFDEYAHQGKAMSVERKSEVEEAYQAYHALGGNGVITEMYQELMDVDAFIVR